MTIRSRIFIGLGVILLCLVIAILWFVDRKMYGLALEEAGAKARIILDQNLAVHTYFSHQLKPHVFEALEGKKGKDFFDPVWMSSTHAVRGINQYRKKTGQCELLLQGMRRKRPQPAKRSGRLGEGLYSQAQQG